MPYPLPDAAEGFYATGTSTFTIKEKKIEYCDE
jgi:hypothetical protein